MKTIILYGMRGTGKSVIGKKLAEKLNYDFIDLDKYISKKNGQELTDFIEKNGWEKFRDEENKSLKEVLGEKSGYTQGASLQNNLGKIISLGGGTIIFERNREELFKDKNNKIIYLNTDLENISERVLKDENSGKSRNSLTGKSVLEELKQVFEERKDIYKNNCDFEVDNNGTLKTTISQIIDKLNYGGVCVPIISEKNIFEFYNEIKNDRKIEFIELRLDLFKNLNDLEKIIKECPKKVICTNRAKFEGGEFKGTPEESLKLLNKCLDFGADYIDIELESLEKIKINKLNNKKIIISYHDFEKTPDLEYLKNILEKMSFYNPGVYKIAVTPNNKKDVDIIFELNNYFKEKKIFISMGKLGLETRINLAKEGNLLSFGAYGNSVSAPGQINYKKLHKQIFQNREVLFLGGPQISGSFSPFMHNFSSIKIKNQKNKILYKLNKINNYNISDAQKFIKKLESDDKYVGANITMPYKIDVYDYLEKLGRLEKNAKLVGAINTLFKKDGKIFGTNTDLEGIKNPILEKLNSPLLKREGQGVSYDVYILGAGGASRAAISAMIQIGIRHIFVLNRSQKKLDKIEKHFKKYLSVNQKIITKIYDVGKDFFPEINNKSIIINTLPFGFKEFLPKSPIKFEDLEKILPNLELYFEAVYDSEKGDTPIVEYILKNNFDLKICRGIEMLIGQAKTGFELWTNGEKFLEDEIKNKLLKNNAK